MKHLNKKKLIRGAGKDKPKAQPAILNPPKLGGFRSVSSFSVAEIIDLISDGPIEGLVDQNGKLLNSNIFQGIYLDNTPIQQSRSLTQSTSTPIKTASISNVMNTIAQVWMSGDNLKTIDNEQSLLFSVQSPRGGTDVLAADPFLRLGFPLLPLRDFPTYWQLSNNKIEIHRVSPIDNNSSILTSFEEYVKNLSTNSNDPDTIKSANNNIQKLNIVKALMKESNYGSLNSVGSATASFIIVDLEEIFDGAFDIDSVDFSIKGISSDNAHILIQSDTSVSKGIVILYTPLVEVRRENLDDYLWYNSYYMPKSLLFSLNSISIELEMNRIENDSSQLFNFSNVSCQFKKGEEYQKPLSNFNKIFNDYSYDSRLLGPFDKTKPIQRIILNENFDLGIERMSLSVGVDQLLNEQEGSVDSRSAGDFSNWNDKFEKRNYKFLSFTHTIENPFVDKVIVSIVVNSLSDTVEIDANAGGATGKIQAGARIPASVVVRVETGKITNGIESSKTTYSYLIAGLIQQQCIIDLGGNDSEARDLLKDTIKIIASDGVEDAKLNSPFEVPALDENEEPSSTKRYVKITKLSAESNSVLISKEISLGKVTEIIDREFSYPFSAIAGIKLDARSFSSVPERSYDCKLKRVKIPSNYQTEDLTSSLDIRYVGSSRDYVVKKQIYRGDWDGTFTEGWTDNPAWILYDLLTSKRYGLGSYIDESQVNKWELYKIAKFCDAVDEEGYFIGVSNGFGGLEPRFSCNIMLREQTKVYDAINVIANLFRGVVFFGGSEVHFLDDRPRTPIALFNNTNVKEGLFNYSNVRRDLQFNTVEILYLDRFDNYKTKVEYVQDEQDIRKRGVFKTTINTLGVTSRAMARRIGQHVIYQTIKENQTVSFDAGLESLLCRPGDLIVIEDEMKTRSANYGKILEVDVINKKLRIDNQFDSAEYTGFVTVYTPTGYATNSEINNLTLKNRSRVDQFSITGDFLGDGSGSIHRGLYKFSGYTAGYPVGFQNGAYPSEFPLYTGTGSAGQELFCYYNTGATGFVFATGRAFEDNNTFDKIITNTGVFFGADISALNIGNSGNYTGFVYDSAISNKRSNTSGQISGAINWSSREFPATRGVLGTEIDTYNISQITKISLTGFDNTVDYGSFIFLNQEDPNVVFLPAVKAGSVYRIERQSASDQIYKIISIRENSQNEYNLIASRYDTGKFETIEKSITQDFLENTYYTGVITVGNAQVNQVATPQIVEFSGFDQTSSNFKLTGRWTSGSSNITGFSASISNSLAGAFESVVVNTTGVQFTGLTNIGNWKLSVTALAQAPNINSSTATTGSFVAYTGSSITTITKPAVVSFSLE